MNTTKIQTIEQCKRVDLYLKQTRQLLAREMSYSEDLRNKAQVSFYEGHIVKLEGMIREFVRIKPEGDYVIAWDLGVEV